jgi:ankyrin repeat protein
MGQDDPVFHRDDPPLFRAALAGDVGQVRRLLDAGAPVDAHNPWGETALCAAADSGSAPTVALLLSAGADPAGGRTGRPMALHYAATADIARLLLDTPAGGSILSGRPGEQPPLHTLVPRDRVDAVAVLLGYGADPHVPGRYKSNTALHLARSAEMVGVLVAAGARADLRNAEGQAPLHTVPTVGAVRALLAAGADPHVTDLAGRTPLHDASSPDVIGELIAAGIPVDATDRRGGTPLGERTYYLSRPYQDDDEAVRVIEILIAAGADVARRDVRGLAPIHRLRRSPSVMGDQPERAALRARMRAVAERALPRSAAGLAVRPADLAAALHPDRVAALRPHRAGVPHPHRAEAVSAARDGVLVRWSPDPARPVGAVATDRPPFVALAASPDGALLALGGGENQPPELRRWDRLDEVVAVFDQLPGSDTVSFSPDGRLLAVGWWSPGGGDGLAVIDVAAQRIVARDGDYHGVERVGFAPDGTLLVAWIEEGCSVLDVVRADLSGLGTFGVLRHRVMSLDFSAGRLLVCGPSTADPRGFDAEPGTVALYDLAGRSPVWSTDVDASHRAGLSPRHPATPLGARFVGAGRRIEVALEAGAFQLDATGIHP